MATRSWLSLATIWKRYVPTTVRGPVAALNNAGFKLQLGRTTINLAPADIKKEGPSFDLPIAAGILAAAEKIEMPNLSQYAMVGELALSGEVRRVKGVLPIALRARAEGLAGIIVPEANAEEAAVVEGLNVYPVRTLREAADMLDGGGLPEPRRIGLDLNDFSRFPGISGPIGEHRLVPAQHQDGCDTKQNPERGREHRDPSKRVASLGTEGALTTCTTKGTRQSPPTTALDQHQQDHRPAPARDRHREW